MDELTKAFEFWITQYPESYHPLDERRFYNFVEQAAVSTEHVDEEWITQRARNYEHNLSDSQLKEFGSRLRIISEYVKDRKLA